ncbi:MAG: DUF1488 domain-containing protein [Gammaproteobacteria bacterium]|nr:DUF1488 domain-containing protein [Gammaproteobacteria bacterium]
MATFHFPPTEPTYTPNTTIAFEAVVDGVMASFEISEEALMDHFGATSRSAAELVRSFKANRPAIEAIAKIKLPERLSAGRPLLVFADF